MAKTPLAAVNHLLDRMAHTLRVMGAVDLPPTPIASFVMPPPFETGLSAALRAIRIEQDTAKIMYGEPDSHTVLVAALRRIARNAASNDPASALIAREALEMAGAS